MKQSKYSSSSCDRVCIENLIVVQLFAYITVFTKPRQVSRSVTLFFCIATIYIGRGLPVSRSPTIRHTHTHTLDRTPLKERSARSSGRYLNKTVQTQQTNTHALSGIRTHHPSNQAAADLLNLVIL